MKALLDRLLGRTRRPTSPSPADGEIHGYLFEDAARGISRDLFWDVRIPCLPVPVRGKKLDCSLAVEWLSWDLRDWMDLDRRSLQDVRKPEMVTASLLVGGRRHPATLRSLELTWVEDVVFDVQVQGAATVRGLPRVRLDVEASVDFAGILVNPDNLLDKSLDVADATRAVADFIDLYDLQPAERRERHYLLAPDPSVDDPAPAPTPRPRGRFSVLRQVASIEHGRSSFRLRVEPSHDQGEDDLPLEFEPHYYYRSWNLETLAPGDWVNVSGEWSEKGEPEILNLRIRGPIVRASSLEPGRRVELTATFQDYNEERMNTWYVYVDDWSGEGAELAPNSFLEHDWGYRLKSGDRIRVSGVVDSTETSGFYLRDLKILGRADT